ncbi:MAG: DUF2062 domain-containing protein [Rhodobacteraceae bacterium]|nr:DUF2062 domain-containing protein [Paracoccaceae bacterium]
MFKRREKRSFIQKTFEALWPRGGWGRAFEYVKHRVRRLPDSPEKISRGIWAGVVASWTPFYGFHFFIAMGLAKAMRGNIFAALVGTFFGNPLTYLPVAAVSLKLGHYMLGTRPQHGILDSLGAKFAGAARDLLHNFKAMFTPETADWHRLGLFFDEVFRPYFVGGIIPGIICATAVYYICVPLIRVYQNRRRKALRARLAQLGKPSPDQQGRGD